MDRWLGGWGGGKVLGGGVGRWVHLWGTYGRPIVTAFEVLIGRPATASRGLITFSHPSCSHREILGGLGGGALPI